MKWSYRLGSLFGIPLKLHLTFLLLLGGLGLSAMIQGGLAAGLLTVLLVSAVFASVVLHELGHALMARQFGIGTRDVTLLPIGGVASLERMPRDPRQEIWIALAGPAVNVALAGLLGIWVSLFGGAFASRLLMINVALAVFNMLPAFPMDGGRVLRAVLARRIGHWPATEAAALVGRGLAVVLGLAGLFTNPMLVFIAIFVWFGAGQEAAMVRNSTWQAVADRIGRGPAPHGPIIDVPPPDRRAWIVTERL